MHCGEAGCKERRGAVQKKTLSAVTTVISLVPITDRATGRCPALRDAQGGRSLHVLAHR